MVGTAEASAWRRPHRHQSSDRKSAKMTTDKSDDVESRVPAEWIEEFEAAARRPLSTRMRYAFIKTYKPVLDDADYRSFDTMADYRKWCEDNLPSWLGYGRV
jgi:hypothetical protein